MTSQLAKYSLSDNVWVRIGPLPLLAVFLGLITLIAINSAWYINQDATPGWITAVCVLNILLALLFIGIMLYMFQIAGSYVISRVGAGRSLNSLSIGMGALNTTRAALLAIGLFIFYISSALFAVQSESQENPNDQTSYFAAIMSGVIISIAGFLLLVISFNDVLQYK